jgi:hypothetical protein
MKKGKEFIFRFNGNANDKEIKFDEDGSMKVPEKDEVYFLRNTSWKVVHVLVEESATNSKQIPMLSGCAFHRNAGPPCGSYDQYKTRCDEQRWA